MYVWADPVMSATAVEIHVRRAHPHDGVRRAGADAGEGEDRTARCPVVPVRQVDGRLLVHHLDRPNLVAALLEHVGQRPAAMSRDAGDDLDALADQVLDDDLSAGESARLGGVHRPPSDGGPGEESSCAGTMVEGFADLVTPFGKDG